MTPTNESEAPQFTITRTFQVRRELVWRAWTDEAEFAAWMQPFGVSPDTVALDVRVGGRYRYIITSADSGREFPTGGEYLEIEPIDRLVFTWGDPDAPVDGTPVITLTLIDRGEQTELDFHVRGYDGRPGDGFVYDGWDQALGDLRRYLDAEAAL